MSARSRALDQLSVHRTPPLTRRANLGGSAPTLNHGGQTADTERLTPQLVEGVRDAVVIREKRYNRKVETSRIAGVVAVALGLLVGGYVWGASGNPSGGQDQLDREVASRTRLAIQHCRDTARWLGDDHQPLCSLTDFLPPAIAGGGAPVPPAPSADSSSDSPGLLMVHPGEPVRFH